MSNQSAGGSKSPTNTDEAGANGQVSQEQGGTQSDEGTLSEQASSTSGLEGHLVSLLSELSQRRQDDQPKPRKLSALGVEIGGWGALVALVVSLVTAGWTLYGTFLAQPDPSVERPIILNLFCSRSSFNDRLERRVCNEGSHLVVRSGPFLFANNSLATNSFLVSDGRLVVGFHGANPPRDSIGLRWQFFSDATNAGIKQRSVAPIEVASRQPRTEEVEFHPRRRFDEQGVIKFIDRYDFIEFQEHVAEGLVDKLTFDFEFALAPGGQILRTSCTLTLGPDFIANASSQRFTLFSRDCDESQ